MKCPCCGYDSNRRYNYGEEIRNISGNFSKKAQDILRKTYKLIIAEIPSEKSPQKLFNFMMKIQNAHSRIIVDKCSEYIEKEYCTQFKGYNYLAAMILGSNSNIDKRKLVEKKIYGSVPPLLNKKEK
jgi:hypothetical protein